MMTPSPDARDVRGLHCLITQPIHRDAVACLTGAGVHVHVATSYDMAHIAEQIGGFDAVITRDAGLDARAIRAGRRLRVIGNHGVGTNKVDVRVASEEWIPVVNTPGTNARSVAEHAITLMLAVAHRVVGADTAARQGNWDFRFTTPMRELHGKTLGIVGYGRIGKMVADTARLGFGMPIVVWSPSMDSASISEPGVGIAPSLHALLEIADIVSLHRPSRPDTRHTLDRAALARMKRNAIIVNTSRGDLIDETALADALEAGQLFGAGLDVFDVEPLPRQARLAALDQVILAPHVAGSTDEALRETAMRCVEQVIAVLQGRQPAHLVDPGVWERRRTFA